MFSKKGSGLYDPVYGDDFIAAIKDTSNQRQGSGCSCHKKKGHGIYDPVYPDRGRCSSSSNSNSRMRWGGYGIRDPVYGKGIRDPVYGKGVKELLDQMGKKEFEKIAEKLRDSVMSLPEKARTEMIDFFIKSGKTVKGL